MNNSEAINSYIQFDRRFGWQLNMRSGLKRNERSNEGTALDSRCKVDQEET